MMEAFWQPHQLRIDSGNIIRSSHSISRASFTVTNGELRLQLAMIALHPPKLYLAVLNCQEIGKDDQVLEDLLRDMLKTGEDFASDLGWAIKTIDLKVRTKLDLKSVYVRQGRPSHQRNVASYNKCFLDTGGLGEHGFSFRETYPSNTWAISDGKDYIWREVFRGGYKSQMDIADRYGGGSNHQRSTSGHDSTDTDLLPIENWDTSDWDAWRI
jgi:hypothetical protein